MDVIQVLYCFVIIVQQKVSVATGKLPQRILIYQRNQIYQPHLKTIGILFDHKLKYTICNYITLFHLFFSGYLCPHFGN